MSILEDRYATREMQNLWTPLQRARVWRQLWLALAETQQEFGLVSANQVEQLRATIDHIDFERVEQLERELRHDVMAHIQAWEEIATEAGAILHLGATSCFITDNADAIINRQALQLIRERLSELARSLATLGITHAATECLSYTHLQPAQPTTVGKRIAGWVQDLVWDFDALATLIETMPCRGAKGTVGTQASFLELLGSETKVQQLDKNLCARIGFPAVALSTQTISRKVDNQIGDVLAAIATSLGKMGRDIRLLSNFGEMYEQFGQNQVGSSAMPYKKNPMRAERLCSLARTIPHYRNMLQETAATQWLERTLDDSACRRVALADIFMAIDGALRVAIDLAKNLVVDEHQIAGRLETYSGYFLSEKIMAHGVKHGHSRQALHHKLKLLEHATYQSMFTSVAAEEFADFWRDVQASPHPLSGLASSQARNYLTDVLNKLAPTLRPVEPLQV